MEPQLEVRPGVAAIIRGDGEKVLLHRRRVGGGWAPPSGHLEAGESVSNAVLREVSEETGLVVQIERLIGLYSDPRFQVVFYPDGRRVQFITSLFECRKIGGSLEGSDEADAWAWFDPDKLPANLLPYAREWLADALERKGDAPVIR